MRRADFATLTEALDYAARGETGLNFYSGKGELVEALPYRDLRQQAMALARRLLNAGLERGERVALIADSDGDFARAFYGCQYAGLVPTPMPLPVALGGKEGYIAHIRRMIESAGATAAFAPASMEPWLSGAADGLDLKIVGTLAALDGVQEGDIELSALDPSDLSYIQFSSGSTRFPLGVAVTQRAVMANAKAISQHGLMLRDGDRAVSWLPLYHDMGLVGFLLTPLTCQITIDLLPTREFARRPLVWLNLISRNRGTLAYSPSFGYELCARRAETASIEGIDLSSWRVAGIGGDMIRPHILSRFSDRFAPSGFQAESFVASYGMAEATLALSFAPLGGGMQSDTVDMDALEKKNLATPFQQGAERGREFVHCGPALPGHRVEVRDESGNALPARHVGRIFAHGPSLMEGYYGNAEESARVLSPDGWLDTGDLGYLTDGQIVITGRAKDLIIINGRNIWPQDLEWAAESEVAALRSGDVAVFSADIDAEEKVIALIHCRSNASDAREALKTEVAGILRMRHGVDATIVLIPPHSLPQTSSGKLSRSKAKAMFVNGTFADKPEPHRESVVS